MEPLLTWQILLIFTFRLLSYKAVYYQNEKKIDKNGYDVRTKQIVAFLRECKEISP